MRESGGPGIHTCIHFIAWISTAGVAACGRAEPRMPERREIAGHAVSDSLVRAALKKPGASLELRWVMETTQATMRVYHQMTRETLGLNDTVLATIADVHEVMMGGTGDPSVVVRFDLATADRLLRTTTDHMGQRLAIIFNGELLAVPRIAGAFGGLFPIATDLSESVSDSLAARILTTIEQPGRGEGSARPR